MTPYRTLVYLVKRKRKYKKLLLPFIFFLLESSLIILISLNILGLNIFDLGGAFVSEPMIYIKMIHPPEMVTLYHNDYNEIPLFSLNYNIPPLITFFNFLSVIIASIGIVIAILWMNRFFKLNSLNIEWWLWPTGCIGAHTMFLFLIL